jgi:hypothetical protein
LGKCEVLLGQMPQARRGKKAAAHKELTCHEKMSSLGLHPRRPA